ncbi:membrane-anchored ubiquitin-fold protein 3-like isoform X2 [Dendrobium catenatum]|uniref:membrane-anchored ubiquitin-fold protein 3-like isoform X2 n=1 Tax=Dendrobium catenatum TaxID=906689 RepID=UPI00109FDF64|nr:membrane-anchored ubiquitin-fold protein 3-like isoform X2 [Dendrobium catenatum]
MARWEATYWKESVFLWQLRIGLSLEASLELQKHYVTLKFMGKQITPKTINDLKLINAGRILENNRTLAESRLPVEVLPGSVITMHVVVRPPVFDKNNEKQLANASKVNRCSCSIL